MNTNINLRFFILCLSYKLHYPIFKIPSIEMKKITLVAHVDMDAFFASIEQRDKPHLQGKPVVVLASIHSKIIIATSYEAKALGVKVGQKITDADQVHIQYSNLAHYQKISQSIMNCLYTITPDIEIFSIDEAFLYLNGILQHYESITQLLKHIKQSIYKDVGLNCSIGLAPNKVLAKMASTERKPNGLFVLEPSKVQEYLYQKPISHICGIGHKMEKFFNHHGIYTCDQITKMPIGYISSHFGQTGRYLWYACQGKHLAGISRTKRAKTMGHSKRLEQKPYQMLDIKTSLDKLTLKLCKRLREHELKANQVQVTINSRDNRFQKRFTLRTATHYQKTLAPIYYPMLNDIPWPQIITQVSIQATCLVQNTQQDWLEVSQNKTESIMDKINQRYNKTVIQYGYLLD